jgi:hypothetical protein
MTFPDSINGETGFLSKGLGNRLDFERLEIPKMLQEARWCRIYNYPIRWYNLGLEDFLRGYNLAEESIHAHLEPSARMSENFLQRNIVRA